MSTTAAAPDKMRDRRVGRLRQRLGEIADYLDQVEPLYEERNGIYCELAELGIGQVEIARWARSKRSAVWAALKKAGCNSGKT